MTDLTDDEIRLIRMLVRGYGVVAKANAQDAYTSEAERQSNASHYRTCVGVLAKLHTTEERLLSGVNGTGATLPAEVRPS